jgi:molecular chaperone Hsp33
VTAGPWGRLELGVAGGGGLRWAVADLTPVVEEARTRLDLSPLAAAALGRSLAGAALLLNLATRSVSRLTVEIRGDGPLRTILAEADQEGNLRGMVGERRVDLPEEVAGKLPVGRAVGRGFLRVLREQESGHYSSQVRLVSGEVGQDLAHYLAQSEQTRSAVLLGVLAKPRGVAAAGGMIVEVLPDADEGTVERLERNVKRVGTVSRLLESEGMAGLVETLFAGLDVDARGRLELRYRCRCSRERLAQHLIVLAAEDRESLRLDDGRIEAECAFCGNRYDFGRHELEPM